MTEHECIYRQKIFSSKVFFILNTDILKLSFSQFLSTNHKLIFTVKWNLFEFVQKPKSIILLFLLATFRMDDCILDYVFCICNRNSIVLFYVLWWSSTLGNRCRRKWRTRVYTQPRTVKIGLIDMWRQWIMCWSGYSPVGWDR